jgi:hypothetical protein
MKNEPKDIAAIFARGELIDRALKKAAREAARRHWEAGYSVPEWRDGRVVWIAPDGKVLNKPIRKPRRTRKR